MTQGAKETTTFTSTGGESNINIETQGKSNIGSDGQMKGHDREKMTIKRSYSIEVRFSIYAKAVPNHISALYRMDTKARLEAW